uniref:Uncharacterized protein n=1 Tax=Arundo donax TaxID=35708 RepID=A0A0A9C330_ARUDO
MISCSGEAYNNLAYFIHVNKPLKTLLCWW